MATRSRHARRTRLVQAFLMAVGIITMPHLALADELRTYPVPQGLLYQAHNDDFTVRVRQPGGPWHNLYEYRIRVDADTLQNASLVYFDFSGKVELEVEKNNGDFIKTEILPRWPGMQLRRAGSIVRMVLDKPERFSIQFDGDRLHNLHILAGALPSDRPTGANVIYFGPGLHTPPDGGNRFPVKSGDRIYLAGGAVLRGSFALDHVRDVKISGRGLLYNPGSPIDLDGGSDIDIRDLIVVNDERNEAARVINIRNSEKVSIREISGFTAGKWSDGVNISTSQHVLVDSGYLRVSDDGVVVYAVTDCPICRTRPIAPVGPPGAAQPADTFDIKVRNLTIWNDVAHALFVGHFGDAEAPRTIRDVSFEKINIVNLDEDDVMWDGALAIFSGNATLIRNVTFSDINVHRIEEGRLINIVAGQTQQTIASAQANKLPGRGIDGVTLRNIHFSGRGMPGQSIISGLSPMTAVRNVSIENLTIGKPQATSPASANIEVGPFVERLSITK